MTTVDLIVTSLFVLVMLANIAALARHYMLMRVLTMALNGMVESWRTFEEIQKQQRQREP
jgi:hypothetical protein